MPEFVLHPGRYKNIFKKLIISAFTLIQRERLDAQWIIATSSLASGRINFNLNVEGSVFNVPNPVHLELGESIAYTQKIKTLNSVVGRHQIVCLTKKLGAKLRFGDKLKESCV